MKGKETDAAMGTRGKGTVDTANGEVESGLRKMCRVIGQPGRNREHTLEDITYSNSINGHG
jgi:hypothetical protein